jgi:hypothetical protein
MTPIDAKILDVFREGHQIEFIPRLASEKGGGSKLQYQNFPSKFLAFDPVRLKKV